MNQKSSTTKQAHDLKKRSHHKWADDDCEFCAGTGETYVDVDEVVDCLCVKTNKAEHEGETAFEDDYQNNK